MQVNIQLSMARYLHVWYYKNGNIGNPIPPKRKKLLLIKHLTKRNYLLALSLIIISGLGFSLGISNSFR